MDPTVERKFTIIIIVVAVVLIAALSIGMFLRVEGKADKILDIAGNVAFWVLLWIGMDYLMKRFVYPSEQKKNEYLAALDPQTRKILERFMGLAMWSVPFSPAAGVAATIYAVKYNIPHKAVLFLQAEPNLRYLITIDPLLICLPLAVIFTALSGLLYMSVLRIPFGKAYSSYKELNEVIVAAVPQWKIVNRVLSVLLGISVIIVLLYLNTYVKVTGNGIAVNKILGIGEKHYEWQQVRQIEVIPGWPIGKKGHRYRISFSDGTDWTTVDSRFEGGSDATKPAVRYISERSGQPIINHRQD